MDFIQYCGVSAVLIITGTLLSDPIVREKFRNELEGHDVLVDWLISVMTFESFFGGMFFLIAITGIIQMLSVKPEIIRILAFA